MNVKMQEVQVPMPVASGTVSWGQTNHVDHSAIMTPKIDKLSNYFRNDSKSL